MAFRGSSFQNIPGEDTPGPPYIGRTFNARMFSPPTFNSLVSHCITNFIVPIIVLSGPSKYGNTDSVSQNFKKLGKHVPGLPHFRVCPPHFLERIVALEQLVKLEDQTGILGLKITFRDFKHSYHKSDVSLPSADIARLFIPTRLFKRSVAHDA